MTHTAAKYKQHALIKAKKFSKRIKPKKFFTPDATACIT